MAETILRLVGIYHADGGVRGELAYLIGKIRGTVHCGLCDITHGGLGRKRSWSRMSDGLGVPFDLLHRNELDARIEAASIGQTPCVLADTGSRLHLLLGPADLDALQGDVDRFRQALTQAIDAHELLLPDPAVGCQE